MGSFHSRRPLAAIYEAAYGFIRQSLKNLCCVFCFSHRSIRRQRARLLHRHCTSLHAHGGAFYAVTHSQRKYHYPLYVVVAYKPATACPQCWRLPLRSGIGSPPVPSHPRAPIAGSHIQKRICLTLFSCQTGLSARKSVLIGNALFQNDNRCAAAEGCPADWTNLSVLRKRHAA